MKKLSIQLIRFNAFAFYTITMLLTSTKLIGQLPPAYSTSMVEQATIDELTRVYLTPQRVIWQSGDSSVLRSALLLKKGTSQAYFGTQPICKLIKKENKQAAVILDLGREIQGGLQITTSESNRVTRKVRIRFGESVSEACSETLNLAIGSDSSTNHHSMRDFELMLPGYGTTEIGNTGYRFVRIDVVEPNTQLVIKEVRGIAVFRQIPYLGSFKCNDERLNDIWNTGAYTVHLVMQDYLLDGIKRDRMVWAGDMHPEIMTINHVFGYNEVVPKSLDFLRDHTPLPKYMNGIPSYSMWWVIMQHDWYQYHGRLDYLKAQQTYLVQLLDQFTKYVNQDGSENIRGIGFRFMDWPSAHDTVALHAGLHAMMQMMFDKGARLCEVLGETNKANEYKALAATMKTYIPPINESKQAAAMLALSGIMDATTANKNVIAVGGVKRFSSFFGYYMLQAQAMAGDYESALNNIRSFWGGMLDLGATTFWEEFEPEDGKRAGRIDELILPGKFDYHHNTGVECYIGLRRSLCHGWASGPTAWLSEHVLGIQVLEPGCKKIKLEPHLGDLQWVEGSFPTPMGVVYVKHSKSSDGKISTSYKAPAGVTIIQ